MGCAALVSSPHGFSSSSFLQHGLWTPYLVSSRLLASSFFATCCLVSSASRPRLFLQHGVHVLVVSSRLLVLVFFCNMGSRPCLVSWLLVVVFLQYNIMLWTSLSRFLRCPRLFQLVFSTFQHNMLWTSLSRFSSSLCNIGCSASSSSLCNIGCRLAFVSSSSFHV